MRIGCNPIGRLGNHLFIVAGTLGLSARLNAIPLLPADWPYRRWFSVPPEFFGDARHADVSAHELSGLPASKRDYLQDLSLWWDVRDAIRHWFQPSDEAKKHLSLPPFPHNIAVHVRRGDYHTLGSDLYVPLWETDYYDRAVEDWSKAHIFTDDPEWCEANMRGTVIPKREDWQSLFDLAEYSKLVCGNSTFSYWAGVIGNDPTPTVPNRWFGPRIAEQGWDPDDFIPEHWRRVDV